MSTSECRRCGALRSQHVPTRRKVIRGLLSGDDPHIRVPPTVVQSDAALRDVVASTFGLAGDLPSQVMTGCGVRVRLAMTSPRPDRVTCLACRERARAAHLRFAEVLERLSRMAGSTISPDQGRAAADRHRALARMFSDTTG